MTDDTKALLMKVLETVTAIKDEHGKKLDDHGKKLDVLTEITETHSQRLTAIEAEQRQIKSMMGSLVVKEVARLDGRIDQLAQDTALGRRAS